MFVLTAAYFIGSTISDIKAQGQDLSTFKVEVRENINREHTQLHEDLIERLDDIKDREKQQARDLHDVQDKLQELKIDVKVLKSKKW